MRYFHSPSVWRSLWVHGKTKHPCFKSNIFLDQAPEALTFFSIFFQSSCLFHEARGGRGGVQIRPLRCLLPLLEASFLAQHTVVTLGSACISGGTWHGVKGTGRENVIQLYGQRKWSVLQGSGAGSTDWFHSEVSPSPKLWVPVAQSRLQTLLNEH